jgi:uncharacterized protein (TIGR03435 family)
MTGLAGIFEWEVQFVSRPGTSDNVPNMSTAFGEELGLKLEAEIAPHEVLVIDRVEMPTPN